MLIDTFPFNKDFRALKIRLSELGDTADLILVSESRFSHSGRIKPLYLENNLDFIAKYRDKVVLVNPKPEKRFKNPRFQEIYQREAITKYILSNNLASGNFIIHSDCDEIPRAAVIRDLMDRSNTGSYLLELNNYANALNLSDGKWQRGRMVSGDLFKGVQQMRKDIYLKMVFDNKRRDYGLFRSTDFWTTRTQFISIPNLETRPKMALIANAGWHFNNLMLPSEIIDKIQNSSHTEWNTEETRKKALRYFIEGRDIYTGKHFTKVSIDESFPASIRQNLAEWREFIRD